MQKALVTLLSLALLASGAVLLSSIQSNRALEAQLATLRAELDAAQTIQKQTLDETRRIREENETFKKESEHLREKLATAAAEPGTPAPASGGRSRGGTSDWMKTMAKMFDDPEMKETMRNQQRMGIRMLYGEIMRELGLSQEDADIVMDILVDRQMDLSAAAMKQFGEEGSPGDIPAAAAAASETHNDKLKSILGDAKFKELESYESSMGDRWMLNQFESEFSTAGAPLAKDQKTKLLAIMQEERGKTPPGQTNFGNISNTADQLQAMQTDEGINQIVSVQEDFNRRVMERARGVLSPDQIVAFEKVQKQQTDLMNTQLKMSRELFRQK
jgi:regulator of replication initiation timing